MTTIHRQMTTTNQRWTLILFASTTKYRKNDETAPIADPSCIQEEEVQKEGDEAAPSADPLCLNDKEVQNDDEVAPIADPAASDEEVKKDDEASHVFDPVSSDNDWKVPQSRINCFESNRAHSTPYTWLFSLVVKRFANYLQKSSLNGMHKCHLDSHNPVSN